MNYEEYFKAYDAAQAAAASQSSFISTDTVIGGALFAVSIAAMFLVSYLRSN